MEDKTNKQNILNQIERNELEAGGIDSWEGYDEALADYSRTPDTDEDNDNWLNLVYSAGVENWEWYEDTIYKFNQYSKYVNENDSGDFLPFEEWEVAFHESN